MSRRERVRRTVMVAIVVWAITAALAFDACAQSQPTNAPPDLTLRDFFVPEELGHVISSSEPSDPKQPTIIHIQEAHTDYETQAHIIGILEQLITQHGLQLILVEGGEGDVGLSYVRRYAGPATRKEVAEQHLKLGILSAEEYLDMASEYALTLWGVEDLALYRQHVQAFLDTETLAPSLTPVLEELKQAVAVLIERLGDPLVLELKAKADAFEHNQLGLGDYAEWLHSLATRQQLPTESWPQLNRFLALRAEEDALQLDTVEQEQQALIRQLQAVSKPESFAALIEQAKQVQAGSLAHEQFYVALQDQAREGGIAVDQFPALARYLQYVTDSARLRPPELAQELEQLTSRVQDTLMSSTPSLRALYQVDHQLALVQRLVELALSPRAYDRLKVVATEALVSGWLRVLNEQLIQEGLPTHSIEEGEVARLQAALPVFMRFYELAATRDEQLIARTLAKMAESRQPLAVLITGGFHAPTIAQRLLEQGMGLVTVIPNVGSQTNDALYRAVVRYKSGFGRLEEVEAAAATVSAFNSPLTQGVPLALEEATQ